ncbi:hypothetical protein SRCM100623_02124 [Acetobacter pasteurianus]|uniref:Uncharacterized protein n=1 Tax=Acetobacter pasteurianus TaxID=438 RepID=A0A1A0D8P1_ACEPA|nr:hypothetical protein SRCM100623_02124 [Acetobacter pasteurianus]
MPTRHTTTHRPYLKTEGTFGAGSAGRDPSLLAKADEDEAVPKFGEAVKLFCISAKLL